MARGPAVFDHSVFVCTGGDCAKAGAKKIAKRLEREFKDRGLRKKAHVFRMKCTGYCKLAPVVAVQPGGCWMTREEPSAVVAKVLARVQGEDGEA